MAVSLNASLNVKLNPTSLASSSKQIQHALGRITGQASEFQKSLDASTARVFAFGATTAVINGVSQSFKKLVSTTIEVEKKLIEINSIFQATTANFNKFRNSIFKVAKETGQSFNTVADGAAELARQGLSAAETAKRLKAALVLTRISGLDSAKSVKALTAAINGFTSAGLSANQIVNKMVAVDTAFAVSTQDLAEAFSRAGSTAEDAGVSFNELLGLVTAVEQRTSRGGAVIGNAFKSIFTRISRGSTIEKLKELGVEIDNTQTGIQKLNALSAALQNVSDPTIASQIKELAGGVFQINVVSAALKDLSSDTSIFAKAAATASSATNEAFEKNAELSKSISSQINVLIQGLTSLSERIGTITFGPLLQNLLGLTTKFTEFLDNALDPEKGNVFIKGLFKTIGNFLSGPAVIIFTAAFIKIFKLVARFAGEGLKSLFAIGSATERIKSIEGGIIGLLQRDDALRKTIVSSTASQAQKEQAVILAIQKENRELVQQAALMRKIASAAAARGVSSFNPMTGSFRGKKGKNFATGFMEEEATARMLGAPDNVQAHFGAGTIGGSRFVMNNSEVEIPNFAGGNSAVIPMYAGGNMPKYSGGILSKSPSQIAELNQSNLNQFTNTTKYKDSTDKGTKAAVALRQKELDKNKDETVIGVDPNTNVGKATMLVPTIGHSSKVQKGSFGRFEFRGKKMGYEYLQALDVEGPKVPKAIDQAADPHDENLEKNITKSVTTNAAKFGSLLKPVLGTPKPEDIERKLKAQGGGKGALRGIIGAAFEASVNAALDISPAKNQEGGDFDVKGVGGSKRKAIDKLFGIQAVKGSEMATYDYKHNKTDGTQASFAKKLANQGSLKKLSRPKRRKQNYAGGYIPKRTKRTPKSFAGGYMPKFAKGNGPEPKSEGGGAGLGGLMMGLFALQTVLGASTAGFEGNRTQIEADTQEKIDALKTTKKSHAEISVGIKKLKEEGKARGEVKTAMEHFVGAVSTASTALVSFGTLSMVTGGYGKKAGSWLMGGGAKAGKATKAQNAFRHKQEMKQFRENKASGMKPKDAQAAARSTVAQKPSAMNGLKVSKGVMAKTVAKRAGPIVAGLFAAYEIGSTALNDDLEQSQKKERYKNTGGTLANVGAGALTGAAIGSVVPILGTAIGGAIGGLIGGFLPSAFGDVEGADRKVGMRKEGSRREAKHFGRLDLDEETFNEAVSKNIEKVNSKQGFEAAEGLQNRHEEAKSELADIIDKQANPETAVGKEEYLKNREKAERKLVKATLNLVGRRFETIEEEARHKSALEYANKSSTSATKKINKIKMDIAKSMLDTDNRVKKDQAVGQIRNSLASSISGPFAGSVALASEQNLMFRDINAAKFDKSSADAALKGAKEDPSSTGDTIIELEKAAAAAGQSFDKAVTGAAVSFKNKMFSIEKGIENIKDKKTQLRDKERKSSDAYIDSVTTGKASGRSGGLSSEITKLEDYIKSIEKKGRNHKVTREEAMEISRLQTGIEAAAAGAGLGDISAAEILKTIGSDLAEKLGQGGGVMSIGNRTDAVTDSKPFDKKHGKGAYKKLQDLELSEQEAIGKLDAAQADLAEQLEITRENYKALEDNESTKRLASNVTTLADQMETAASSVANLNAFSATITTQVADTSGLIERSAAFVKKQEGMLDSLDLFMTHIEGMLADLTTPEK